MFKKILCVLLSAIMILGASFSLVGCDKSFTVTFDPNGGYIVEDDKKFEVQTVESADQIIAPIVKRHGYNFIGWDKVISKINKDITVKAQWRERAKFTIEFSGNHGTLVSGTETQSVRDASDIVLPVYERPGYTLTWDEEYIRSLTSDAQINASWVPKTYNLSFIADLENENWDDATTSMQIEYDTNVTNMPKPTNKDELYRLGGWVVVDNGEYDGIKIYEGSKWNFTKDISVKPVWVSIDHIISYNLDGGFFENNNGINTYKETDENFLLNNPVRTGYDFIGWTSEDIIEPQLAVIIASGTAKDLYFTANWKAKQYTITLDANGGQCNNSKLMVTYGEKIGNLPTPYKEGFSFVSWTYESFSFNGGYNDEAWEIAQSVTLKANYIEGYAVKIKLKYEYTQEWVDSSGKVRSQKHVINYTCNGQEGDINAKLLLNQSFYDILSPLEIKAKPQVVNVLGQTITEVQYKFKYWAYVGSNGREYEITDQTVVSHKMAVNGVITIVPVGRSLYYGPY